MKAHVQDRLDSIAKGTSLNWAAAEAMAFGTLLCQGKTIVLFAWIWVDGKFIDSSLLRPRLVRTDAFNY